MVHLVVRAEQWTVIASHSALIDDFRACAEANQNTVPLQIFHVIVVERHAATRSDYLTFFGRNFLDNLSLNIPKLGLSKARENVIDRHIHALDDPVVCVYEPQPQLTSNHMADPALACPHKTY